MKKNEGSSRTGLVGKAFETVMPELSREDGAAIDLFLFLTSVKRQHLLTPMLMSLYASTSYLARKAHLPCFPARSPETFCFLRC
jgi:hypothetical protein